MPKPVTTSCRTLIAGAGVLFVVLVAAAITIVWLAHRARSAEARWRDQAAKTRLAQSQADFVHACFEAESGRRSNAVALLARSVRNDPNHLPSRMRLFFLLVQNSWPVPAIEPPPGHSPPNKTPDISQLIASLPAGSELVRALPDPEAEPSSLPKTSPVFLRPDGDEIIVLVNSWDGSSQGKHGRLVSFSTETGEAVSTIARFSNPVQDGAVGSGSLCAVLTGGNPREVAELHLLDLATGEMKMAFPVPSPRVTEGSDAFVGDITFTPSEQAVRVVWSDFSNPNLTSALYIDVASGHVLSTNGHAPVAPPRDHKFKLPLAGAFVTGATSVDNRWEVVVRVNSDPKGFASFVAQLWDAETGRNYYSDAVDDPEAGALPRISNLGGAGDESVVNDVDGRCVGVVVDPSRGPIANILSSFVIASDSSAVWAVDCGDERPKSYYTGQFDKRIDEIGTIGKVVFLRT
ncbi:MAG: hypothetical protein P8J87_04185, partial [Verrucomicrobiales bacterium]|nr:hypothetical protein [Verrucomicrobiales bacterium]